MAQRDADSDPVPVHTYIHTQCACLHVCMYVCTYVYNQHIHSVLPTAFASTPTYKGIPCPCVGVAKIIPPKSTPHSFRWFHPVIVFRNETSVALTLHPSTICIPVPLSRNTHVSNGSETREPGCEMMIGSYILQARAGHDYESDTGANGTGVKGP